MQTCPRGAPAGGEGQQGGEAQEGQQVQPPRLHPRRIQRQHRHEGGHLPTPPSPPHRPPQLWDDQAGGSPPPFGTAECAAGLLNEACDRQERGVSHVVLAAGPWWWCGSRLGEQGGGTWRRKSRNTVRAATSEKLRTAGIGVRPPRAKATVSAAAARVMDGPACRSTAHRCWTGRRWCPPHLIDLTRSRLGDLTVT